MIKIILLENRDNTLKRNYSYGKPILQFTLNGKFIKEWKSAVDVYKSLKIPPVSITANLKNRNQSAYGCVWKYKYEK